MRSLSFVLLFAFAASLFAQQLASPPNTKIYRRENLVAWCIVPFDSQKRSPEARAEMLKKLGFSKFAYDWRGEHIASFDDEIAALKKQKIELTAWWFPASLDGDAQKILAALKRNDVKTQLWITMGDPPGDQGAKVESAVKSLRPLVKAAADQDCKVGLYNHGGWFGQPENQLAIIEALKSPDVGMIYNLHHGHEHLDRFETVLPKIKPHLYALNLNGMDPAGDQHGRKILQLGQGELDLKLLRIIAASGYEGPIGILGHTQDDAEKRLADNLDGLDWLVKQLEGKPAGDRPQPRTPVPPPPRKQTNAPHEHGGAVHVAVAQAANPPREFDPAVAKELVTAAEKNGDARRGLEVFADAKFACASCHQIGMHGGNVGPALTSIGKERTAAELAESLLWPQRQVKPEYIGWQIVTTDGRSRQGYKRKEDAKSVEFYEIASQKVETIAKEEIEDSRQIGSLMPDNLLAAMTPSQRRDMLRLLTELGRTQGLAEAAHSHNHQPVAFDYEKAPLHPERWPLSRQLVNRDRLYDYYTKEALHFRQQKHLPSLLPAFPGLDGGKQGHWGNQKEDVWKDGRWNDSDLGTLLSGVFRGSGKEVPKGICVRLGDKGELATCFNPQTLSYEALWRGGFLQFSEVRHGFMDGLRPKGEPVPLPKLEKPSGKTRYLGFWRVGPRVAFEYEIDGVTWLDAPWCEEGKFVRVAAPRAKHPLNDLLGKSPPQWPQEFVVKGERGPGRPYGVDNIPLPVNNPWKAQIFPGDHAFLKDGSLLVCTMQGDVWLARGIDDALERVRWKRFAAGLHQSLGMIVRDENIYVIGRDQITQLVDLNHDDEADWYACHHNAMETSTAGHDYTCGLELDAEGRFYTASGKQGLIRLSHDSNKQPRVEVLATGFRNPDGLGLATDGAITVPCSEGEWTPSSMICLVEPNKKRAESAPPHFGYGGPREGKPPALPLVYLPRGLDNSSGGQATVPNDNRWGPLASRIVHTSFGAGTHFLLLRDEVAGQPQGAIVPLPGEFRSGTHRAKFNPHDGQLYVSGMAGWGSYTPEDGCVQRVRYTGDRVQLPTAFHIHENGVLVTFTENVDAKQVQNARQHLAQTWNYRYSQAYGSPELSTRHPNVVGHDALEIAGVHLIDSKTVFVELPELQPVNVLHLALQVGEGDPQELFVTVHKLDKPFTRIPNYRPSEKIIAAHPQLTDLASMKAAVPNPWKKSLPNARTLTVAAAKNLSFSPRRLEAKPGEALKISFVNPDVVPHNWVLIKPGRLAAIGDLTNKLVADPEAVLNHYVPKSDDVLAYTDIVNAQGSFSIYITAPKEPGVYSFLCTFPGHWMVMNGELVVK